MLSDDYPVSVICDVVGLPRSSYYYSVVECDETPLKTAMEKAAAKFPTYGSRRLTEQVKREAPEPEAARAQAGATSDAGNAPDGAPQKTAEAND